MRTIISLIAVFTIAMFYTSCNDEGSILTTLPENQTSGAMHSFTGTASGLVDVDGGPTDFTRVFTGEGTCELMGECFADLNYVINAWDPVTRKGTFWQGKGVLTDKSNGHKSFAINISGSFEFDGPNMTYTASGILSGGTGRYKNFAGTLTFSGGMHAITREGYANWTGTYTLKKPFSGVIEGNVYPQAWTCNSGPFPSMGRLGDGTGELSHFDMATADFEYCVAYLAATEGFILDKDGDNYITAPNGDKIQMNITGGTFKLVGPADYNGQTYLKVVGSIFLNITGGTGRFSNASGTINCEADQYMTLINPTSNPALAVITLYGAWSY